MQQRTKPSSTEAESIYHNVSIEHLPARLSLSQCLHGKAAVLIWVYKLCKCHLDFSPSDICAVVATAGIHHPSPVLSLWCVACSWSIPLYIHKGFWYCSWILESFNYAHAFPFLSPGACFELNKTLWSGGQERLTTSVGGLWEKYSGFPLRVAGDWGKKGLAALWLLVLISQSKF